MLILLQDVENEARGMLQWITDKHRNNWGGVNHRQQYSMVHFTGVRCPNCGNECIMVGYWSMPNPEGDLVCNRCEEVMRDYDRMDEDYYDDDDYVGPYDYDYDDDLDEFEEALGECGMTPEGFCENAGTESCDFECPFSDAFDED